MRDTPANEQQDSRQNDGRSFLYLTLAALLAIMFGAYSLSISDRCYASDGFYESLFWVPGLFGILLLMRPMLKTAQWNQTLALGIFLVPCIWLLYYMSLSFLIFTTSSEAVQFQTQITSAWRGRGCYSSYLSFDNKPVHREVSMCGDGIISGIRSSDTISVTEKAGPFGVYFQHADKLP
jgi:hypothetical protein